MTGQIKFTYVSINSLAEFERQTKGINLVDCDIKLDVDTGRVYFIERYAGTVDCADTCVEQYENDDWDICAYID